LLGIKRRNIKIKLAEDGVIEDAKVQNNLECGLAIASSSLLNGVGERENVYRSINDKRNTDIAEELAFPPVKIHCFVLAEDAISAAIEDYKSKKK
jgi:NifU homolog involved in Fe-S cluster formation